MEKNSWHDLKVPKGQVSKGSSQGACLTLEKNLKSRPLRMHFQHSGAKIRVFEQNTDIVKLWLFCG